MIHEHLIFIICSPRSGSTLLQRMLGSHSAIHTHPEPHLITPLYYLGYYDTVTDAPYDHINAAQALRELTEELPRGEEDYLDALRAYACTIYERILQPANKAFFLDKTPAYALVLPFLCKLFPRAKYVVLTRHPMAVLHSQAHSFFGGDYAAANATNPVIHPYTAAIGSFLLDAPVQHAHVRYEDLVKQPEEEMRRVLQHLGLEMEPGVVEYGRQKHITKSYGDPISVQKHDRPVTHSVSKWAADLLSRPDAQRVARRVAASLDPDHLRACGYPAESLFEELGTAAAAGTRGPRLNTYRIKRRVFLQLRRNIRDNSLGSALRKVRYYCDVLLRP